MFRFLLFGLFVVSVYRLCPVRADCLLNFTNSDTEKNIPVPLHNISSGHLKLALPNHGAIHLQEGQNLSLSCAGNRNYVRQTNSNVTTITCVEENTVKLYRKIYKFEEIQCKNIVRGEVRPSHGKCANGQGRVYHIGYQVNRWSWTTLFTVCYQPETGNTLYTEHAIHGKQIKYASKTKYRPSFSTAGQHPNITADLAYKQVYQKATFSSIFGSSLMAEKYINDKSFLARGHLAPHADFLLATAQFSTYFYINAAPQWQSINGASWKSIESTVRSLASHYGLLEVFTGTHGILTYNGKEIFLGRDGILPVPKYFWKTVYDRKTKEAITFVILNDPFAESPEQEAFCNDICQESGFLKDSWKDPSSGYVFCCNFSDFTNEVYKVPVVEVEGVLKNPVRSAESKLKQLKFTNELA